MRSAKIKFQLSIHSLPLFILCSFNREATCPDINPRSDWWWYWVGGLTNAKNERSRLSCSDAKCRFSLFLSHARACARTHTRTQAPPMHYKTCFNCNDCQPQLFYHTHYEASIMPWINWISGLESQQIECWETAGNGEMKVNRTSDFPLGLWAWAYLIWREAHIYGLSGTQTG